MEFGSEAQSHDSSRERLHTGVALGLILVAFFLMVLPSIGVEPWVDELTTEQWTTRSYGELWASQYAHKFYSLFAKASTDLFGDSISSIRLPARLFSLGSLLVMFALGKRLKNNSFGLLLAALLILSPEFWIRTNDARGYSAVILCQTLILLAALPVARFSIGCAAKIASLLLLAYLFHPTALLAAPPILILFLVDFWTSWRSKDSKAEAGPRLPYMVVNTLILVGVFALIAPYFMTYFQYGSLNIPKQYLRSDVAALPFPTFFTWVGFLAHVSPTLAARGVVGAPLVLAATPFVVGFVGLLFTNPRMWILVCAPILTVFAIPLLLGIDFIPQRYLTSVIPLELLTSLAGILFMGKLLKVAIPGVSDRLKTGVMATILVVAVILPRLGPLVAEVLYPLKPGTLIHRTSDLAIRPCLRLLTHPFFESWYVVYCRRGFVSEDTLKHYGVAEERILEIPSLTEEDIGAALESIDDPTLKYIVILDDGDTSDFDFTQPIPDSVLRVHIMEKSIVLFAPHEEASESFEKACAKAILESVGDSKNLSSEAYLQLSKLAETAGDTELSAALFSRGMNRARLFRLLDRKNRKRDWVPFFSEVHRSRNEFEVAIQVYLDAIGTYPYSPKWFVELFQVIPIGEMDKIALSIDFVEFKEGFRKSLEIYHSHSPEYQKFWTLQLARYLYRAEMYEQSLIFCEMAKEFGPSDPFIVRLQFRMLIELGRPEDAARLILAEGVSHCLPFHMYNHAIKTLESTFSDFKGAVPNWVDEKSALVKNIVTSLNEDENTTLEDKQYTSYWLGMWFVSNREHDLAKLMFEYCIELGDPEGKAALVLQWMKETGGRGAVRARPR